MAEDFFVHETSVVDDGAIVGKGTKIWHFSHISKGAVIGEDCRLGQNVFVGGDVQLGRNVKVQNNVSIYDKVVLEDNVFCGPSCVFTNVFNPRSEYPRDRDKEFRKTVVREGTTIGANSTLVCGIEIGKYAFIGAGAVATKDIPAYALVYGNPAKINGWMCECGEKVDFDKENGVCRNCSRTYIKKNTGIERK